MQNTSTYIERLVDFVYDCRPEKIPADVREKTAFFVLDTLGVAVTNREKPFVQQFARAVAQTAREGPCTAVGLSNGLVAEGAAMVNSTAIHGNDFDATHIVSIIHPCSVVVPTVLAVAEEVGAKGADVMAALVSGFEVLIRMGLATKGTLHRTGFQSTALCAPVVLSMFVAAAPAAESIPVTQHSPARALVVAMSQAASNEMPPAM